MQYIVLVFILLMLLAVALAAYWFWRRQSNSRGFGFLEYVRDPNASCNLEEELAKRDDMVRRLATESPEHLVELLLEDADQFGIPCRAIRAAGHRVVPALLSAVGDARFRGGNQKRGILGTIYEPLEGVLICLGEFAPAEAVSVVCPLLADGNDDIRYRVAFLLGSIGSDQAAGPVAQILKEDDDHVRSGVLRGILKATNAGRASETFRRIVFDGVLPLAFRRIDLGADRAARCLLALDHDRAVAVLTDPTRLVAGQENLHYVLQALREANVTLPEVVLLGILSELEGKATKHPDDTVVGETLLMLATLKSKRGMEEVERGLTHPSRRVREKAAMAKVLAAGLDDPTQAAFWSKLHQIDWGRLSDIQRNVLAVRMLIDEVKNGGFPQYFVNCSGDHWRDAIDGLHAIGADIDRQLLEAAVLLFGSIPPSEDHAQRRCQLAKIAKRQDRPFDSIEFHFFKDDNGREVLLRKYIVENASVFR